MKPVHHAEPFEAVLAHAADAFERCAKSPPREDSRSPTPEPRDIASERVVGRLRALGGAGWGARTLRMASAPTYDEAKAARYLEALRSGDGGPAGRIIVLAGQPGSGKTSACARWALTRPSPAANGRFATPRLLSAAEFFRASRYQRGEGQRGQWSRDEILGFETLVLDDLGTEYADASGNYRVDLDELVNRFYEDDRTLVITTNLLYASEKARADARSKGQEVDDTAQTFADRYGERIIDRVRECGRRFVDSAAPSMRGVK